MAKNTDTIVWRITFGSATTLPSDVRLIAARSITEAIKKAEPKLHEDDIVIKAEALGDLR